MMRQRNPYLPDPQLVGYTRGPMQPNQMVPDPVDGSLAELLEAYPSMANMVLGDEEEPEPLSVSEVQGEALERAIFGDGGHLQPQLDPELTQLQDQYRQSITSDPMTIEEPAPQIPQGELPDPAMKNYMQGREKPARGNPYMPDYSGLMLDERLPTEMAVNLAMGERNENLPIPEVQPQQPYKPTSPMEGPMYRGIRRFWEMNKSLVDQFAGTITGRQLQILGQQTQIMDAMDAGTSRMELRPELEGSKFLQGFAHRYEQANPELRQKLRFQAVEGREGVPELRREFMNNWRKHMEERARWAGPVDSFDDIRMDENFLGDLQKYSAGMLGEHGSQGLMYVLGAGSLIKAGGVLGGMAGAARTGERIGAGVAASATYPMAVAEHTGNLWEKGVDDPQLALMAALPSALLESGLGLPGRQIRKALGEGGEPANVIKQMSKAWYRRLGPKFAAIIAEEAIEEGIQTAWEEFVSKARVGEDFWTEDTLKSVIQGTIGGMFGGIGAGGLSASMEVVGENKAGEAAFRAEKQAKYEQGLWDASIDDLGKDDPNGDDDAWDPGFPDDGPGGPIVPNQPQLPGPTGGSRTVTEIDGQVTVEETGSFTPDYNGVPTTPAVIERGPPDDSQLVSEDRPAAAVGGGLPSAPPATNVPEGFQIIEADDGSQVMWNPETNDVMPIAVTGEPVEPERPEGPQITSADVMNAAESNYERLNEIQNELFGKIGLQDLNQDQLRQVIDRLQGNKPPAAAKPVVPAKRRGDAHKGRNDGDLLYAIASMGGIKPDGDIEAIFDGKNPLSGGAGNLIRKNGHSVSDVRQMLEDDGWLDKDSDDREVYRLLRDAEHAPKRQLFHPLSERRPVELPESEDPDLPAEVVPAAEARSNLSEEDQQFFDHGGNLETGVRGADDPYWDQRVESVVSRQDAEDVEAELEDDIDRIVREVLAEEGGIEYEGFDADNDIPWEFNPEPRRNDDAPQAQTGAVGSDVVVSEAIAEEPGQIDGSGEAGGQDDQGGAAIPNLGEPNVEQTDQGSQFTLGDDFSPTTQEAAAVRIENENQSEMDLVNDDRGKRARLNSNTSQQAPGGMFGSDVQQTDLLKETGAEKSIRADEAREPASPNDDIIQGRASLSDLPDGHLGAFEQYLTTVGPTGYIPGREDGETPDQWRARLQPHIEPARQRLEQLDSDRAARAGMQGWIDNPEHRFGETDVIFAAARLGIPHAQSVTELDKSRSNIPREKWGDVKIRNDIQREYLRKALAGEITPWVDGKPAAVDRSPQFDIARKRAMGWINHGDFARGGSGSGLSMTEGTDGVKGSVDVNRHRAGPNEVAIEIDGEIRRFPLDDFLLPKSMEDAEAQGWNFKHAEGADHKTNHLGSFRWDTVTVTEPDGETHEFGTNIPTDDAAFQDANTVRDHIWRTFRDHHANKITPGKPPAYVAKKSMEKGSEVDQPSTRTSISDDELWSVDPATIQEHDSAATSINVNKTAATFTKFASIFSHGMINADIGGGKYDNATQLLQRRGIENVIYDPFNRDEEHNAQAIARIRDGKADMATVNNVLNTIKEPLARELIIRQAANALKPGGTALFSMYEGDKSGNGAISKTSKDNATSWQENRRIVDYRKEITPFFDSVSLIDGVIVAKLPKGQKSTEKPPEVKGGQNADSSTFTPPISPDIGKVSDIEADDDSAGTRAARQEADRDDALLIVACCDTKDKAAGEMMALERYKGAYYQMITGALDKGAPMPYIMIMSAEHGLIGAEEMIEDYNRKLTPERAQELARDTAQVVADFFVTVENRADAPNIDDIFIAGGKDYRDLVRAALLDFSPTLANKIKETTGGIGQQRQQLAGWMKAPTVADAAADADPDPSDAQKEAGNYKMGHITFAGLDVSIENAKGSERSGTGADGKPWSVTMPAHYGYIKGTEGADGDHIDVYLNDNDLEAFYAPPKNAGPTFVQGENVWIIDQVDAETGEFDEHKVMLGFPSIIGAKTIYRNGFSDGKGNDRIGAISGLTMDQFKAWIKLPHLTKQPFANLKAAKPSSEKGGKNDGGVLPSRKYEGADPTGFVALDRMPEPTAAKPVYYVDSGMKMARYTLRMKHLVQTADGHAVRDSYVGTLGRDWQYAKGKAMELATGNAVYGTEFSLNEDEAGSGSTTVGFGKHKGRSIEELIEQEPDYVQWLISSGALGRKNNAKLKKAIDAAGVELTPLNQEIKTIEGELTSTADNGDAHWLRRRLSDLHEQKRAGNTVPMDSDVQADELPQLDDDAATPDSADLAVIRNNRMEIIPGKTQAGRSKFTVIGKGTFDAKDLLKGMGAKFDRELKGWAFYEETDPTAKIAAALTGAGRADADPNADNAGPILSDAERERLRNARDEQDGRSDERAGGITSGRYVTAETQSLLKRGVDFNIPEQIIDDQIEDVAWLNKAYQNKKGMFLLANDAGTGKTFVLGAAIRELRQAGAKRFIYVTMNTDLIDQIQKDLAAYGMGDVEFVTYAGIRSEGIDGTGAVVIFDETQNIKNVTSAQGAVGQSMIEQSEFTVFASATPFENPVQAQYLEPTGIFQTAGGFDDWALMYGAAQRKGRTVVNYETGQKTREIVIYWPGGKRKDGAAARDWFFKQGVMTQRAMQIPTDQVETTFHKFDADEKWVTLYNQVEEAYASAANEYRDEEGNILDHKIYSEIARHRENAIKRVLEASKLDIAVKRAQDHLNSTDDAGNKKNVVIFVETKSERHLGRFGYSQGYLKQFSGKQKTAMAKERLSYVDMKAAMDEWRQEVQRLKGQRSNSLPPPPFADFIEQVARAYHDMGIDTLLPSTSDVIVDALGGTDQVGIYTGAVTNAVAKKNKEAFLAGRKRVLMATMDKGGTGLSLHDTVGNRPTVQININLPWVATKVEQVSGRVARYGLRSRAEIEWIFADNIAWERDKLAPRVGQRMRDMGAVVKGIETKAAEALLDREQWDLGGAVLDVSQAAGEGKIDVDAADPDGVPDEYRQAERLERQRLKADDTSHGFFATPYQIAAFMTRVAGLRSGMKLLEPSAGHGALIQFVPEGVSVDAVELRQDNLAILEKKFGSRHNLSQQDFMDLNPDLSYDTILMNPPFERVKGLGPQDIAHVRKAYNHLKEGGRMVAIMGEGAFFREAKPDAEFREWLDDVGAFVIRLPENAFKKSGTGVRARLVIIDKGSALSGEIDGNQDVADNTIEQWHSLEDQVPARIDPNGGNQVFQRIGQSMKPQRDLYLEWDQTPEWRAQRQAFANELIRIARHKAPGLEIFLVDNIYENENKDAQAFGTYFSARQESDPSIIEHIALVSMQSDDRRHTTNHEIVHFLRRTGRITPREWAMIERMAIRENWLDKFDIREDYPELSYEGQMEEAVAQAQAGSTNGTFKVKATVVKGLFNRIKAWIASVRAWLKDRGFNDVSDIFAGIDSGEIGKRKANRKTEEHYTDLNAKGDQKASGKKFYSALLRAAQNMPQVKGSPQQILAMLKKTSGVKQTEIDWVDLEGFMAGKKSVTKDEVVEYIQANQVDIKEFQKSGAPVSVYGDLADMYDITVEPTVGRSHYWTLEDPNGGGGGRFREFDGEWSVYNPDDEEWHDARSESEDIRAVTNLSVWRREEIIGYLGEGLSAPDDGQQAPPENPTKYGGGEYIREGLENYTELLLTMPHDKAGDLMATLNEHDGTYWNLSAIEAVEDIAQARKYSHHFAAATEGFPDADVFAAIKSPPPRQQAPYRSSHWDEDNVLAHVRFGVITGANGEKILFIDEIQSDWHQAGRKMGYRSKPFTGDTTGWKAVFQDGGWYEVSDADGNFVSNVYGAQVTDPISETASIAEAARRVQSEPERTGNSTKVPDAPLKKTWHQMALRRMVKMAVDNGFDKIAWTTGTEQNERYSLSNHVDALSFHPVTDGYQVDMRPVGDREWVPVNDGETIKESDFPSWFGEGPAQAYLNELNGVHAEIQREQGGPWEHDSHTIETAEMDIGGSGMTGFYDKILPNYANKWGKKFGTGARYVGGKPSEPVYEWAVRADDDGTVDDLRFDQESDAQAYLANFPDPDGFSVARFEKTAEGDQPHWEMDITDAMREDVQGGVSVFQRKGPPKDGDQSDMGEPFRDPATGDQAPVERRDGGVEQLRLENLQLAIPHESVVRMWQERNVSLVDRIRTAASWPYVKSSLMWWREGLQDYFLRPKQFIDAIEGGTGKKVSEDEDFYGAEELYTGRIGARLDQLMNEHIEPFLKAIHQSSISITELEDYLYAQHKHERDEQIQKINPKFAEEGGGSGLSDARYNEIMERVTDENRADYENMARRIRTIIDATLDYRVSYGLMTAKDAEKWKQTYKNYVPLRGISELTDEAHPTGSGQSQGFQAKGPESRRALGRESEASEILANVFTMAQETVIRGEKNRVFQSLHNAIVNYPDPNVWNIADTKYAPLYNTTTGLVEIKPTRQLTADEQFRTITGKVAGREVRVEVHDQRFVDAFKRLEFSKLEEVMRSLGFVNRWLSMANTTLNPEFLLTNMVRDLQASAIVMTQYDQKRLVRDVFGDWKTGKPIMAGIRALRNKPGKNEWDDHWKQYVNAGGKVSFYKVDDVTLMRKTIDSKIMQMRRAGTADPKRVWDMIKATAEFIENVNLAVDNGVRLALFKNLVARGYTPQEAARAAKNITVNFNRKGKWGPALNALFLFYNAGTQGTATIAKALYRSSKVRKLVMGIFILGMINDMMQAFMSDEEDDGELTWDNLTSSEDGDDYVKGHNIVIKDPFTDKGKGYFTVNMPYGFNFFFDAGQNVSAVMSGRKTVGRAAKNIVLGFFDAFVPEGGSVDYWQLMSPTVTDPWIEIAMNKNFMGAPIWKDPSDFDARGRRGVDNDYARPDFQKHFKSVNPASKFAAKFMSDLTGGDDDTGGGIDVSPESIDHIFEWGGGAAVRFWTNLATKTLPKLITGEIETKDVPFLRKLHRRQNKYRPIRDFYAGINNVRAAWAAYNEKPTPKAKEAYADKHGPMFVENVRSYANFSAKRMGELRDMRLKAQFDGDKTAMKEIDNRIDALVSRFNTRYGEIRRSMGDQPGAEWFLAARRMTGNSEVGQQPGGP